MAHIPLWKYFAEMKTKKQNFTLAQLAEKFSVNIGHLSRVMAYKTVPSPQLAKRIEDITKGQVCGWTLLKECMKQKEKDERKSKRKPVRPE